MSQNLKKAQARLLLSERLLARAARERAVGENRPTTLARSHRALRGALVSGGGFAAAFAAAGAFAGEKIAGLEHSPDPRRDFEAVARLMTEGHAWAEHAALASGAILHQFVEGLPKKPLTPEIAQYFLASTLS